MSANFANLQLQSVASGRPCDDAAANSGCAPSAGSPDVEHRKAWQKNFIVPIAQTMKQKGVAYLLILIRDDGKASYVLDTEIPPNKELTD